MADQVIPHVEVGSRVTDYIVVDLRVQGIASGGMGLVAWGPNSTEQGAMRAVKMIRPDRISRTLSSAFEEEALVWCHLPMHPSIIRAFGVTRLPDMGYAPVLYLEYAEEGSLRSWMEDTSRPGARPLSVARALAWAQDIALALVALHTPDPDHERPSPLVHCDLKPENVLISGNVAKIADMGLSRVWARGVNTDLPTSAQIVQARDAGHDADPTTTSLTHSFQVAHLPGIDVIGSRGPVAGTRQYMPPEQWWGVDAVRSASDIYAFGVLLFEMFSGGSGFPHRPVTPGLEGWYTAHSDGPQVQLMDRAALALSHGPLSTVLDASPGNETAVAMLESLPLHNREQLAQELLEGLDTLVTSCLEPFAERRPTAAQVLRELEGLAVRLRLIPRSRMLAPHMVRSPAMEAMYWTSLAVTYGRLGNNQERVRLQKRAVDVMPNDPQVWHGLSVALGSVEQYETALEAAKEVERLLEGDLSSLESEMNAEAIALRRHVLAYALPHDQGYFLWKLSQYSAAVAAFQRSLAANPDKADSWYHLAETYLTWAADRIAAGDWVTVRELLGKARVAVHRALAIAPQYPDALVESCQH